MGFLTEGGRGTKLGRRAGTRWRDTNKPVGSCKGCSSHGGLIGEAKEDGGEAGLSDVLLHERPGATLLA
jgi:hypothetical protein